MQILLCLFLTAIRNFFRSTKGHRWHLSRVEKKRLLDDQASFEILPVPTTM
jgi:hypothetical protein